MVSFHFPVNTYLILILLLSYTLFKCILNIGDKLVFVINSSHKQIPYFWL